MITATTPELADHTIARTLGVVSGEAIIGAHLFRDFMANIHNVIGGRAGGYEKALRQARDVAIGDMMEEAREKGADAIVGVDLDYEAMGTDNGMMMVTASGTAVKLG